MQAICLENDETVIEILSQTGVKEVICGHGHATIVETSRGVTQYMAPATAYGFDHSIPEYNRSQDIGFARLTLFENRIEVEAVSLISV